MQSWPGALLLLVNQAQCAWSRCREQSRQANARSDAPPLLWALPKYAQIWPQFWRGSAAHVHWRRSSDVNRSGVCRGSHRRPIGMRRAPATEDPHLRAAHSTHPSRMPWNSHYDAREECAERLDGSSQGAPTSASPLRALPSLTNRHCDGCSISGREQHRRIRTPACFAMARSLEYSSTRRWRPPKFQLSSPGTGKRPR